MNTRGRLAILGSGFGLYLVGLGLLGVAILNQHDDAVRKFRSYLVDRTFKVPTARAEREPDDAPAGIPKASARAKAHRMYLAALFRARQQGSLDGVLRTAEAFAALGDHDGFEQSIRIAEALAAQGRDVEASNRVRKLRERLASLMP